MDISTGAIIDTVRIILETAENSKGLCQTQYLINEAQAKIFEGRVQSVKFGFMFRLKSFWVGWHYSDYCRRHCINIFPCFTVWIVLKGGQIPRRDEK